MPDQAGLAARSEASSRTPDPTAPQPRRRAALSFTVRPEAAREAAEVLAGYASPQTRVDDHTRLLATTVFLGGNRVLRVADVAGDLGAALRHLAAQPTVREVERRLDPLLTEARDMSGPDGARAFFARAMLRCADPARAVGDPAGEPLAAHRSAALLPVPEGAGARAAQLLAAVTPTTVTATVAHRDDVVVWLLEGDQEADRLLAAACADPGVREAWIPVLTLLDPVLGKEAESAGDGALAGLLAPYAMRRITDRRAS